MGWVGSSNPRPFREYVTYRSSVRAIQTAWVCFMFCFGPFSLYHQRCLSFAAWPICLVLHSLWHCQLGGKLLCCIAEDMPNQLPNPKPGSMMHLMERMNCLGRPSLCSAREATKRRLEMNMKRSRRSASNPGHVENSGERRRTGPPVTLRVLSFLLSFFFFFLILVPQLFSFLRRVFSS